MDSILFELKREFCEIEVPESPVSEKAVEAVKEGGKPGSGIKKRRGRGVTVAALVTTVLFSCF